jgi:5-(carboxyamino)imidazole ribonucleotide synthase
VTSQFSNHLRAITDTHPGNTIPAGYAGMINLLGRGADAALLQEGDTALHWYDKSIRGRRKVGHINLQSQERTQLQQRLSALEAALYPEGAPL